MRELKLKYIIQLLSDVGAQSNRDAKTLEEAQKRVRTALGETENKVGAIERALLRMGGVGSQSATRQADYLSKLALRYHDVRKAAEGAVGAMQRVAQLGAGVAAGAYAVDRMTQAPMEYSTRLAQMANTAYSDRDVAGRIAGKQTLDAAIKAAVRVGGGTRDSAAGALDFLIASGAVSPEVAIKMLPMIMRSSTASGATPEQLAGIGVRGMQSFGISLEQLPMALNMAMQAGQAGGFELKDMAKWLPQAMAAGKQTGLSGLSGFQRILASMQASVITAGTKDEAGNNLVNLLAKINSSDTAKDFAKQGINLTGELAAARAKGMNSLDAFVGLVDRVTAKDPEYVKLRKRLDTSKDQGERRDTLEAITGLLQGSAVGQVIQDRQALMALVAEMGNRSYVQKVMGSMSRDTGAMDTAFGVMADETSFKRQQALAESANASQMAFDKLAPTLNKVFDGAVGLGREFPVLTAAVVATAGTLSAIAAGLGAAGLAGLAMGGDGAAGTGRALAGRVAGAAAVALPWLGVAGSGAFAMYELWRLGDASADLYSATHREGVTLTPESQARLRAMGEQGWRGRGFNDPRRLDQMPMGPSSADLAASGLQGGGALSLGEGRLAVDVRVTDERATAVTTVTKPMPIVRIDAGATNPAGYAR